MILPRGKSLPLNDHTEDSCVLREPRPLKTTEQLLSRKRRTGEGSAHLLMTPFGAVSASESVLPNSGQLGRHSHITAHVSELAMSVHSTGEFTNTLQRADKTSYNSVRSSETGSSFPCSSRQPPLPLPLIIFRLSHHHDAY